MKTKAAVKSSLHARHTRRPLDVNIKALEKELRKERAGRLAAERRASQLEYRLEEALKENRVFRKGRSQTEELLNKEIRQLKRENKILSDSLDSAKTAIAWFQKQFFGSKSEQTKAEEKANQDNTSDSGHSQSNSGTAEGKKRKRGQQPGSKGHGRSDRSNLEKRPIRLTIDNCACPECQKPYLVLPDTDDSTMTAITVTLFQYLFQRSRYVAQCDCLGKQIVTAPAPPRLYPRTNIDNSLWVFLAVRRFLGGEPTNRTLKELGLKDLPLSAGTVVGGFKLIAPLLDPLYGEIVKHCQGADFWHADETSHLVFEDDLGSRVKQLWWDWVIASRDAVVYMLDCSRSKQVPAGFFAGSSGVLMTDRLASYKNLHDAIKNAWCWVHQRRDFIKLYDGNAKLKDWALKWMLDITHLFVLNHKRLKVWQDNRSEAESAKAQQALEQHVQKLQKQWDLELKQPNLHKQQKTALNSLKKHWQGLTIFVLDPRIPMENNRAERLLRGLVVNRKNSFGSGKEWAGHLAAKFHTIFQTWLANGLNPESLLLDFFNECAKTPGRAPPDLSSFLPWTMSEERKLKHLLPQSYKKPG